MRKIILIHAILLLAILLCAFSPWLAMLLLGLGGDSGSPSLRDLGLGVGILGMVITPLGLLAAGAYIVGAIVFHFAFSAWRKSRGAPPQQGYLIAWMGVVLAGSVMCVATFSLYSLAQGRAEQARITPAVLEGCAALLDEPVTSSRQNGLIAVSTFNSAPEDGETMHGLLILNADGSLLRHIPLRVKAHSLAWSPDGAQIVISDETNLYLLDPLGGEPRPITQETRLENNASLITNPAWSPNGALIYFEKRLPGAEKVNLEIFAIRPDGNDLRQITDTPGYNIAPQSSPDGAQIAFVSSRDGGSALYIMDSAGGNPQRLTTGDSTDTAPFWSPDGRWLAFLSNRDGGYQVYLLNVAGGATCQLTAGEMQPGAPVWSPDGQYILFHDSGRDRLALLRPDGSGLRWLEIDSTGSLSNALGWAGLSR